MIQRCWPHSTPVYCAFRRERCVAGPSAGRRTAGHEEAREHHHRRDRSHPKRKHVQFGKRHIACADHQRNEKIAEGSHHDRHDDEENHDRRMHGKNRVIGLRRNDAAALLAGIDVRLGDDVEPGDRSFRPSQLPAHEHGEQAADDDHEQAHEEKLPADHLVIEGKNIRSDKP